MGGQMALLSDAGYLLDVPVTMSNGMGVDSAAWLTAILTGDLPRPFDLADLTVVTAMTGDEYPRTKWAMETYLLPLMAAHGVRYVQISRAGQSDDDRYVKLSDTHPSDPGRQPDPYAMRMRGPWALSDELRAAGTVPQVAHNKRLCSYRAKAQPMEWWIADEYKGRPRRHVIGYAAEETKRAVKDTTYRGVSSEPWYPLIAWGWDRRKCLDYLRSKYGIEWPRSCCGFCPFQAGKDIDLLGSRWADAPEMAVQALTIEFTALALNPRMALFGDRTARSVAQHYGLTDVIDQADEQLARVPWSIYEVKRVFRREGDKKDPRTGGVALGPDPTRKGQVWRSLRTVATGPAPEMTARITAADGRQGYRVEDDGMTVRLWLDRASAPYPAVERYAVAAPAGVPDKERAGFDAMWHHATNYWKEAT
jgi:hypothetical protein